MRPVVLDTREIAPFASGFFVFRYKWAEYDRCKFKLRYRRFERIRTVTGEIRHSLAGSFRSEWESNIFFEDSSFINYFFDEEPGAIEIWGHIARIAQFKLKRP